MDPQPLDLARWAPSIDPYSQWIDRRNPSAAKNWAGLLVRGEPAQIEDAVAEAVAWDWLANRSNWIDLGSPPGESGPDFRCRVDENEFFVEVTNISRAVMTEVTGMPDRELFKGPYGSPADRLRKEITGKAQQGAAREAPYLVLATTLHWNGSILMTHRGHIEEVLHSRTSIGGEFDPVHGLILELLREATDMKRAAFTASGTTDPLRSGIAGALFGPFGLYPEGLTVHGILNPTATHPFDPDLLPEVPFPTRSHFS